MFPLVQFGSYLTMALLQADETTKRNLPPISPNPSCMKVIKRYIYQQTIQEYIKGYEVNEELMRLQGVAWIDGVRKLLHMYER